MKTFLITMIVVMLASGVGKLIWLASGSFPQRKAWQEALDVVIHAAIVAWAAVLLFGDQ